MFFRVPIDVMGRDRRSQSQIEERSTSYSPDLQRIRRCSERTRRPILYPGEIDLNQPSPLPPNEPESPGASQNSVMLSLDRLFKSFNVRQLFQFEEENFVSGVIAEAHSYDSVITWTQRTLWTSMTIICVVSFVFFVQFFIYYFQRTGHL